MGTTRHLLGHVTMSLVLVGIAALASAPTSRAAHVTGSDGIEVEHGTRLVIPMMDPERGKTQFVEKGCVACHAINGVGGHDAPPMDDHRQMGVVNPFDFAAKMWNHAPGMIAAQQDAFGEQIYVTGTELADIIAFLHNEEAQHTFDEDDLTDSARKMMDHEHSGMTAPSAHAEEVGHGHEGESGADH